MNSEKELPNRVDQEPEPASPCFLQKFKLYETRSVTLLLVFPRLCLCLIDAEKLLILEFCFWSCVLVISIDWIRSLSYQCWFCESGFDLRKYGVELISIQF